MKKTWDEYLELNGFEDIEKKFSNFFATKSKRDPIYVMDTMNYYYWATQALHNSTFKSETDEHIWQRHIQGLPSTKIAQELGFDFSTVLKRLKNIEKYLKEK